MLVLSIVTSVLAVLVAYLILESRRQAKNLKSVIEDQVKLHANLGDLRATQAALLNPPTPEPPAPRKRKPPTTRK